MSLRTHVPLVVLTLAVFVSSASRSSTHSARDPDFGEAFSGLSRDERALFDEGFLAFAEEEDEGDGLGPTFNHVGCAACHSVPTVGGSSPINETRAARVEGGRYVELPGGSLFQTDATRPDCAEVVPAEANVRAERQTQPLFGLGLVEAVPDWQIEAYARRQRWFVPRQAGRVHRVRDVASGQMRIGRFGWKCQVATLDTFSGDAYLNEMGITSPIFPQENPPNGDLARLAACDTVPDPEDDGEDLVAFTNFMRMLAPPPRADAGTSSRLFRWFRRSGRSSHRTDDGERLFNQIGCASCHANVYRARSRIRALDGKQVEAFSDLLLHDVGTGDGIVQGEAQGNEFRTAPLWGLAVSAPYLHDGRAATIEDAIGWHAAQGADSALAFERLPDPAREAVLEFLGSI